MPEMNDDGEHLAPNSRATLKTVAEATGLAVATVSRALKDATDIGEATKERVREAAAKLGYRPNRAGVRLRTGKTNVIALVLSPRPELVNSSSTLIHSIAAALRGTAYHLIVMPFFADEDPMTPVRYIVETGSADGVILNQTTATDPRVRYLAEQGFPFVTHGRTDMGIEHAYFDFDNEEFARIAVRALVKKGRSKLLLVAPTRDHYYTVHLITGFQSECAALRVASEVLATATSDSPTSVIERAIAARCQKNEVPDGMIAGSTTAAMPIIAGAEAAGLTIGRDFDAVSRENTPFLHQFRREAITVPEDISRAGDYVARALVAQIEKKGDSYWQYLDRPTEITTF